MHDFHQLHLRDRIEEVDAHESGGIFELLREHLDLDARGIGREHRVRLHARFELRIEGALCLDVLENGLDDDVRERRAFTADVGAQARDGLRRRLRVLQALLQEVPGPIERRLNQLRAAILQGDVDAPKRGPGRDVSAHHAGADHVQMTKSVAGLPPSPFSRFCSRNTRTRFRDVAEHMSVAMEWASAS